MLGKIQNKRQAGFTIIEVLIVLAIAGLIMLIVFLAIPALQRNQRNGQRSSEGSRIVGLISECLSNRNGQTSSCDSAAKIGYATSDFGQLTTDPVYWDGTGFPTLPTTSSTVFVFNKKCNADQSGLDTAAPASPRQFAVVYQMEGSGTIYRCLNG